MNIQHHANPEVDAMLGMYERGVLREPDFGQVWGVALSQRGLRHVSLRDVYRAWTDLLYMVVEMENGIANDLRMRHEPFTDSESPRHVMLTRVAGAAAALPGGATLVEVEPPSFTIAAEVGLGHGSNAERVPKHGS